MMFDPATTDWVDVSCHERERVVLRCDNPTVGSSLTNWVDGAPVIESLPARNEVVWCDESGAEFLRDRVDASGCSHAVPADAAPADPDTIDPSERTIQ